MAHNVEQSFTYLSTQRDARRLFAIRQGEVANNMQDILHTCGALVFARRGLYGGREGAIGSSNPGIRYIQGTYPVRVDVGDTSNDGVSYIALQHSRTEAGKRNVLLVQTSDDSKEYLRSGYQDVIATAIGKSIDFQGIENPDLSHLEAVATLVDHIGASLGEHVFEADRQPLLPAIRPYDRTPPVPEGVVTDLTQLPRTPWQLSNRVDI